VCSDSQSLLSALAVGPIDHRGDIENRIWSILLELADVHETPDQLIFDCPVLTAQRLEAYARFKRTETLHWYLGNARPPPYQEKT
jgi:hypothetical protein